MTSSETKNLVLSSKFEEMNRLEPFVDELKEWAKFSEEDSSRIMLSLSEAVNNAIMHGNEGNAEKDVVIHTMLDRSQRILQISVEDEGEGFDPEEIPDPLKDENLLNEGGRGIYLIKEYADDIQFSKSGSKVTITFNLENN